MPSEKKYVKCACPFLLLEAGTSKQSKLVKIIMKTIAILALAAAALVSCQQQQQQQQPTEQETVVEVVKTKK